MNIYDLDMYDCCSYEYDDHAKELINKYKKSLNILGIILFLSFPMAIFLMYKSKKVLFVTTLYILIMICLFTGGIILDYKRRFRARELSYKTLHDYIYYKYTTSKNRKAKTRYLIELCRCNVLNFQYEDAENALSQVYFRDLNKSDKESENGDIKELKGMASVNIESETSYKYFVISLCFTIIVTGTFAYFKGKNILDENIGQNTSVNISETKNSVNSTVTNESSVNKNKKYMSKEEKEEQEIHEYYRRIYDSELADSGYTMKFSTSAKGQTYVSLSNKDDENKDKGRRLVYDRESKNGKCCLFVYYEDTYSSDGDAVTVNNTKILNFYAVVKSSGEVISADKTSWEDCGSEAYRKETEEL